MLIRILTQLSWKGDGEMDDFEKEEMKDWDRKTSEERRQLLQKMKKHEELVRENVEVGVMFASKAVVQVYFKESIVIIYWLAPFMM